MIIVNWVFTIVFFLLFVVIVSMSYKVFKISGSKNHMLTAMIITVDLSALFSVFFYALQIYQFTARDEQYSNISMGFFWIAWHLKSSAIHINIRNWTYYLFKIEEFSGKKTKNKIKCLDQITISSLVVKTVCSAIAFTYYEIKYFNPMWCPLAFQ